MRVEIIKGLFVGAVLLVVTGCESDKKYQNKTLAECAAYYVYMENKGADTRSFHIPIMYELYENTSSTEEAQALFDVSLVRLNNSPEENVSKLYKGCLDVFNQVK